MNRIDAIIILLRLLISSFRSDNSYVQSFALQLSTTTTKISTVSSNYRQNPTNTRLFSTESSNTNDPPQKQQEQQVTYYSPNIPLTSKHLNEQETTAAINNNAGSINEYSFFDEAIITVRAGSGGQGASTYKNINGQNGPPDGGNGGKGGNVMLKVDPALNTLAGLSHAWRPNAFGGSGAATTAPSRMVRPKTFRAENGTDGDRQFKNGKFGKDMVILVPPGTIIQEQTIDSQGNVVDTIDLGSLIATDDEGLLVARGGEGGDGSGVQAKNRGVRRPRHPAKGGQKKTLKLTLKIVADCAIVGVPSAGKSTFLASVTRAKPKISNYPFTTIVPNLGVFVPEQRYESEEGAGSEGLVLCDVPGLIQGASEGVGLGHAFLRHVERCHVILHLLDATSNDPVADYEMLNEELVKYGTGELAKMPQVVVVNKIDAYSQAKEDWEEGLQVRWSREELQERLAAVLPHTRLMWMSAREKDGVEDLMGRLMAFVNKVKEAKNLSVKAD